MLIAPDKVARLSKLPIGDGYLSGAETEYLPPGVARPSESPSGRMRATMRAARGAVFGWHDLLPSPSGTDALVKSSHNLCRGLVARPYIPIGRRMRVLTWIGSTTA